MDASICCPLGGDVTQTLTSQTLSIIWESCLERKGNNIIHYY